MHSRWIQHRHLLILIAATFVVVMTFVGLAAGTGRAGFPLDDAWIHQTYARNLAGNGRWEYSAGISSSGSTSPLWTLLLAAGYLLHVPHLLWTYLLGAVSLLALALAGRCLWRLLWPDKADKSWVAGLALLATWPLIWAAASGMETLLFASLGLWSIALFAQRAAGRDLPAGDTLPKNHVPNAQTSKSAAFLGMLCGLLILARPEGFILLLLIGAGLAIETTSWRRRIHTVGLLVAVAGILLSPYVLFNLRISGNIWPNTLYAKQVEYGSLLTRPLPIRLIRLLFFNMGGPETGWQGSSGAHLLLLPGVITAASLALKRDWIEKRPRYTLPLLWAGGHILLYAWRLPVTYHHGRYLLAATPVWVLYGLSGSHWLLVRAGDRLFARLLRRVAILSFAVISMIFLLLGAQSYATDVAFIEGEMVTVARWLARNTPEDALVATHDIGAIGYYSDRELLDLAGLITPEVIPWLADEAALSRYLLASDADYLVSAPGWPYETVASMDTVDQVYSTGFAWTQEQGENNMTVYRLPSP